MGCGLDGFDCAPGLGPGLRLSTWGCKLGKYTYNHSIPNEGAYNLIIITKLQGSVRPPKASDETLGLSLFLEQQRRMPWRKCLGSHIL